MILKKDDVAAAAVVDRNDKKWRGEGREEVVAQRTRG